MNRVEKMSCNLYLKSINEQNKGSLRKVLTAHCLGRPEEEELTKFSPFNCQRLSIEEKREKENADVFTCPP